MDATLALLIGTNVLIIILLAFLGYTNYVVYCKGVENGVKLDVQHLATNGRLDQLLAETKTSAHAEGRQEERNSTR